MVQPYENLQHCEQLYFILTEMVRGTCITVGDHVITKFENLYCKAYLIIELISVVEKHENTHLIR
jgi:hypothetical protein